ncbi:MAG: TIGR01459 family HAD-type hydrolase [Chlamydiae bacterium]|nr:TIGR01459 family HAD-type hydrolase [Chlamydiota bacterium]
MTHYSSLLKIVEPYKGILLDAWGVFWAGNALGMLPGSLEALEALVARDKYVGILSNATRIVSHEVEKLKKAGMIQGKHYHFLITSGELARQVFLSNALPFQPKNNKYFVLGGPYPSNPIHTEIFADSVYEETSLDQAGFIYASTPQIRGEDQEDASLFDHQIEQCLTYQLPLICANPDTHAQEGNPAKVVIRQGYLAKKYKDLGGDVYFIGKPYPPAFESAIQCFKKRNLLLKDILMIGDTPETDIAGAKQAGIDSALITGTGITADRLKKKPQQKINELLKREEFPSFFLKRFIL